MVGTLCAGACRVQIAVPEEERVTVSLGHGIAHVPGGGDRPGARHRLVIEEALHRLEVEVDHGTASACAIVVEKPEGKLLQRLPGRAAQQALPLSQRGCGSTKL